MQIHGPQHLRHHAVNTGVFEELALQLLQGSGHLFEWRPIAQGTRLALNQLNIALPVATFVLDAMTSTGLSSSEISRNDITSLGAGFRNKSVSGIDALISLGLSHAFEANNVHITPYA